MQLDADNFNPQYQRINSYNSNKIVINNTSYTHNLLILDNEIIPWNLSANKFDAQDIENLLQLTETTRHKLQTNLIIFGTGAKQQFFSEQTFKDLYLNNIGFEVMNTTAACRTYNLIINEKPNLLMALLI